MKRCPYCDTPLREEESVCPSCGAEYWNPDHPESGGRESGGREIEEQGCLSLLMLPLGVSLAVFAGLLLCGFLLEKLFHWDSLPVRFIWIALSAGIGLRLFDRLRGPDPDDENPNI